MLLERCPHCGCHSGEHVRECPERTCWCCARVDDHDEDCPVRILQEMLSGKFSQPAGDNIVSCQGVEAIPVAAPKKRKYSTHTPCSWNLGDTSCGYMGPDRGPCDKTFQTCRDRFGNQERFNGMPKLEFVASPQVTAKVAVLSKRARIILWTKRLWHRVLGTADRP